ncbi:NAD-dependent epimerase/dehydratase family protein, partial [Streptomyces sp. NPDC127040]|uniref:NAD-dependent epimerase/dehydratase family protein n=1 Tax=Streptomyces sp. NPDC127040 TaxID=3347116 RepID=UPI00365158B5
MGVVGVGGRVLVVGAAGFVGSAVVRRLVGLGVGVRLLVHRVAVQVELEDGHGLYLLNISVPKIPSYNGEAH